MTNLGSQDRFAALGHLSNDSQLHISRRVEVLVFAIDCPKSFDLKRSILMTHNLDTIVRIMDIIIETRDLPTSGDSAVSCYWVGAWVSRF